MPDVETEKSLRWTRPLLYLVAGFLLFETLTGLSIYLLPFSLTNQVLILVHTAAGLIFILPYGWYQIQHWLRYRRRPMTEIKFIGYIAMASVAGAVVSGAALAWEAAFEPSVNTFWKNVHIVSTFTFLASVVPHVGLIILRNAKVRDKAKMEGTIQAEKSFGFNSLFVVLIQFTVALLFMYLYTPPEQTNVLSEDYMYHHGSDRPFAPSLATTTTGNLIDPELLGGSQSCGSEGCHSEIMQEWESSAHRYAASDPFFREIQENMGEQRGPVSARYCAGCHDPVGLFAGSANLYSDELTNKTGLDEGVSCLSCHSIVEADVRGNADYVIRPPERYMFELQDNPAAKWISDFLIRAYPEKHVESYQRPLFKTSEYCAACHKQYIDEDINNVGWVQLQNQYDNWQKSHWYTEGKSISTIECRECHMPLVKSGDPSRGDAVDYNRSPGDEKHRSHRFLGANQAVPTLLDLPGAEEHVRLIEEWLRGEIDIPEISDKWETGPAIPIRLISPETVPAGEELAVDVLISNQKPGHDFPTGPLDMIQSWVELIARDQNGNILFSSGTLDDHNFIQPGSFMFKAEPVDQYGNLIDRHNLWDMVGVRYSRALFPGRSDYARYSLNDIPEGVTDIVITAKLQYRKFNQFLMNEVFSERMENPTAPVTTISADTARVTVISQSDLIISN